MITLNRLINCYSKGIFAYSISFIIWSSLELNILVCIKIGYGQMFTAEEIIHFISISFYIIAFIVTLKFYLRVKEEKFWIGLPLGVFGFLLHELFEFLEFHGIYKTEIYAELSEIIAALILIVTIFKLSLELAKIHKLENSEELNNIEE